MISWKWADYSALTNLKSKTDVFQQLTVSVQKEITKDVWEIQYGNTNTKLHDTLVTNKTKGRS